MYNMILILEKDDLIDFNENTWNIKDDEGIYMELMQN